MNTFESPYESNIRFLPLVYFLPEDVIEKYPTLRAIPRNLSALSASPAKIALINGDAFLKEIADAMAGLAFPNFGFRGWIEDYSGYFAAWQFSYALQMWARGIELETGWDLGELLRIPPHTDIQYLSYDFVKEIMERVVKRVIEEEGWQPVFDVIREMPCDEDFERKNSNVRKDFLRRWYHTRSKRVQAVSLEACMADKGSGIHTVADGSASFVDKIVAEDYCTRFMELLSPKDREILQLRIYRFTYEEIADKLGYKNHSGVIKRMQFIKKIFLQYEQETEQQ